MRYTIKRINDTHYHVVDSRTGKTVDIARTYYDARVVARAFNRLTRNNLRGAA